MVEQLVYGPGPGTEEDKEPTSNEEIQEGNQPNQNYVDENGVPNLVIGNYKIPLG